MRAGDDGRRLHGRRGQPVQQAVAGAGEPPVGQHRVAHAGQRGMQGRSFPGTGGHLRQGTALDMDGEDRLAGAGQRDEGLALGAPPGAIDRRFRPAAWGRRGGVGVQRGWSVTSRRNAPSAGCRHQARQARCAQQQACCRPPARAPRRSAGRPWSGRPVAGQGHRQPGDGAVAGVDHGQVLGERPGSAGRPARQGAAGLQAARHSRRPGRSAGWRSATSPLRDGGAQPQGLCGGRPRPRPAGARSAACGTARASAGAGSKPARTAGPAARSCQHRQLLALVARARGTAGVSCGAPGASGAGRAACETARDGGVEVEVHGRMDAPKKGAPAGRPSHPRP
jgi:hypothetical protein